MTTTPITITPLPRKFLLQFPAKEFLMDDPNPNLTPQEIKTHFTAVYPELASGEVIGPEIKDDAAVYTISGKTIGTKG